MEYDIGFEYERTFGTKRFYVNDELLEIPQIKEWAEGLEMMTETAL